MTSANNEAQTPDPTDEIVVSQHTVTVNGEKISYTARTGIIILKEESEKTGDQAGVSEGEKKRAKIFFIAYTRDNITDLSTRPITFSFNGGPGSSSVWMHLGLLGPKRVDMEDAGKETPPPYQLVENEYSLLEKSDLVFIDPVSTGYSRPVEGEKAKTFHGFKRDIESVGDFIRLFTTRYQRWSSPKYLIGESYGTTRAAGLSGYLQERHSMYLNGIIMVSSILDFSTAYLNPGNDLPYILFLPTFTATAWYHNCLGEDLQADLYKALEESETYAMGDYTLAMMRGDELNPDDQNAVAEKLSRLTGMSTDYIHQTNLRINIHRFCKELLRTKRRTVGRIDSRFTGIDRDAAGEFNEHDPSISAIMGPYTGAMNDYVRRELNYQSDLPYEILSERVFPWSYAEHQNKYVNVAETLRKAISINPNLRVHVANGYYDLATPYLATRYTYNHLMLDDSLRGNISMSYYEAGHMMYLNLSSLAKLKKVLADFIDG
jgi:carboxypeptidase C (cathepsin A)